jgi:acetyl-CoA acyltransferase
MPVNKENSTRTRAVIVGGARTPFLRAFGDFTKMDSIALGAAAVKSLLHQSKLPVGEIDGVVWGGVILPSAAPNLGREIVLDLGLPRTIEAATVTRACTSGLLAITQAVAAIERGEASVMIAGGSDSTSNAEVNMPQSFVHKTAPVLMNAKAGVVDYFKLLGQISLRKDLLPQRPQIRERTTGELMGEAAERMVKHYGVSRAEQDAFAAQSHHRAAAAIASGRFANEIAPVITPSGKTIDTDNMVRADTTVEKLAKLRPVFAKDGSLTAGNSSGLTDGAAAVLVMSEEKARALGFTPLASFESWSYDAVDPADQLLIGPAVSMPRALGRAGLALSDVDIVDIHEAFAGQVLSVLRAMASSDFARQFLGNSQATGELAPESINVHGGSVALGHPFGATGARMVLTIANELYHSGKETALLSLCAAGGQSAALLMRRVS